MPRVPTGPRTNMSSKLLGELTQGQEHRPVRCKGVDTLEKTGVSGYMETFERGVWIQPIARSSFLNFWSLVPSRDSRKCSVLEKHETHFLLLNPLLRAECEFVLSQGIYLIQPAVGTLPSDFHIHSTALSTVVRCRLSCMCFAGKKAWDRDMWSFCSSGKKGGRLEMCASATPFCCSQWVANLFMHLLSF